MMAVTDADSAIRENVKGPRQATSDGVSVVNHDLADQIEVDRYLASKKAALKGLGMRRVRVNSPGPL